MGRDQLGLQLEVVHRTIDVTVNDGIADSNIAVATIAIDRAPDAADDSAATSEDTAVTIGNVLANDDLLTIGNSEAVFQLR